VACSLEWNQLGITASHIGPAVKLTSARGATTLGSGTGRAGQPRTSPAVMALGRTCKRPTISSSPSPATRGMVLEPRGSSWRQTRARWPAEF